jgi:two-component system chemotaxis sensor kinase CheA
MPQSIVTETIPCADPSPWIDPQTSTPMLSTGLLDVPILLNLIDDADLLAEFCRESRGLLEEIESAVLALEQDPGDAGPIEAVFRAFHTFKGGAGFLKLDPIHCLTHDLESVLEVIRSGRRSVDQEIIELILASVDVLGAFLAEVESQLNGVGAGRPITVVGRTLHQALLQIIDASEAPTQPSETPRRGSSNGGRSFDPSPHQRVRDRIPVSARRLEELLTLVGRLQRQLAQESHDGQAPAPSLAEGLAELEQGVRSLFWIPCDLLFQRMHRVVRDASVKVGKPVHLSTRGGETLLDRRWEQLLADCLMHLLRNAIDHGIESPSVRCEHGKPPVGEVTLAAETRGDFLYLDVTDDGAGIATAKVLDRARHRGLIGPEDTLSEERAHQLIFEPGFSTADSISVLSGRGVGMDVVRSNIEALGGSVQIRSEEGRGTRFILQVPLTETER